MTKKIPDGFHTVTPSLNITDAASALELYKKAFGAQELYRMADDEGKIMHACLQIGTSKVFVAEANPEMGCGPSTASFYLYVENVDGAFGQARNAGLNEYYPVQDMFWGDRTGTLKDRYGNSWMLATHVKDMSDAEMKEGQKKFMKDMAA